MAKRPYSVGYKRPPLETRFRPGQSGNPAGRPKGTRNFQSLVRRCLEDEVQVTMGARKQKMSLMEALLRRLLGKAMSGDLKALVQALNLARLYDGESESGRDPGQDAQQLELLRQLLAAGRPSPEPTSEG